MRELLDGDSQKNEHVFSFGGQEYAISKEFTYLLTKLSDVHREDLFSENDIKHVPEGVFFYYLPNGFDPNEKIKEAGSLHLGNFTIMIGWLLRFLRTGDPICLKQFKEEHQLLLSHLDWQEGRQKLAPGSRKKYLALLLQECGITQQDLQKILDAKEPFPMKIDQSVISKIHAAECYYASLLSPKELADNDQLAAAIKEFEVEYRGCIAWDDEEPEKK